MVEFDPLLSVLVVGVFGIVLWIVTNLHLVRTGRAIKADIDAKRADTEEFVTSRLKALETGIQAQIEGMKNVEIDGAPLLAQIQTDLIPAVEAKVENVKSVLLGKLGYTVKGMKQLGEGAVKLVGEKAAAVAGFDTEWQMRLDQLGMDEAWMKENKVAAAGLSLIKELAKRGQMGATALTDDLRGTGISRRAGPPQGFG